MTTSTVKKDASHSSAMRQRVDINGHELYLDVPAIYGGANSAPTPHDYIDAALLACKAITIRMIAKQKKIPLTDVNITLKSDASQERKGRYPMDLEIELVGNLTEEQRQMLFNAAEQCPTGKMLSSEVKVDISAKLV